MADQYLDFDLHIYNDGNAYRAEVRSSPAGTTPPVPLQLPFLKDQSADELIDRLESAIVEGRRYGAGLLSSQEKTLREFGCRAFRAVFRDNEAIGLRFRSSIDIARQNKQIAGVRLKLGIEPPELAMLPWEYIFDESVLDTTPPSYLCLRYVSPIVRFLQVNAPVATSRIKGPLRILGMVSNPNIRDLTHLDIGAERHALETAVKRSEPKVEFEWVKGGSFQHLRDALYDGDWHIFHFIGHGGTQTQMENGVARNRGFVFMEDEQCKPRLVDAEHLAMALETNGNIRLAMLNCCDSARGSSDSSPGAHLVRWGVPAVVAMQFAISNKAASTFATGFYRAVVNGDSVERATTSARREVRYESDVEWGIPVLFTRTDQSIGFDINIDTSAAEAESRRKTKVAKNAQARAELRQLLGVD